MAEKVTVGIEVDSKSAEKNVDNLTDGIKDLTKSVDEGNKQIKEGLDDIKETSKSTGEGVRGIGNAIKAAGVGVFLIALESMKELFMQNQVIADSVSSAFEGLALVFNDVFGLLTGGLESVEKIGNAFDKYFGKPIETAVKSFEKFGDAFSKIFGGDFSGALESAQEGFSGLGDAISQTGDGFVEATSDAVDYVVEVKDAAIANVQLAKSAELAEATNAGLLEKYDRQAEKQRQIRDEERNSIEDRIKANNELGRLLEEQNTIMLKNANISLKAAKIAFEKNKSTENEVALIQAQNEVLAVQATVEGFRSEQKANDLALDREKIELSKTQLEAETTLAFERRKFDAEQELVESKKLERLIKINQDEKTQEEIRLQGLVDSANEGTQARVDAQIALDQFLETNRQESITLEKQYNEAIIGENKVKADAIQANFEKEKEIEAQRLALREQSFNDLLTITGEETKLGKAVLIAKQLLMAKDMIMEAKSTLFTAKQSAVKGAIKSGEAGVDLAAGAAKTAATVPFPFNIPLIVGYAAQALGIFNSIKQARAAQKEASLGLGGSEPDISAPSISAGSAGSAVASQAPSFNIVGQSGVSQLADVVASQEPIKAFVVSTDVTTAQGLERNIVEGATL